MLTKELRNQTYETAAPAQQYLYADTNSGADLFHIATQHQLTSEDLYTTFALTVGDIILGFYDIADTEPLLVQELGISAEVATPLAADVINFLAPLNDPNWQPPVEEELIETAFESVTATAEIPPAPVEAAIPTPATPTTLVARPTVPPIATPPQPAATPADVPAPATPGIRTMAQDMEGVRSPQRNTFDPLDDETPTHVSSQSWGTDQSK